MRKWKRKYNYLVSFTHKYGTGCVILSRSGKVKHPDDVLSMKKYIMKDNNLENVGVMGYQLVNKEWVKDV